MPSCSSRLDSNRNPQNKLADGHISASGYVTGSQTLLGSMYRNIPSLEDEIQLELECSNSSAGSLAEHFRIAGSCPGPSIFKMSA